MDWLALIGLPLAIGVVGVWSAPRIARYVAHRPGVDADLPCAFGHKMSWIAIKTRDTARLMETLHIEAPQAASWSLGIATVYHERVAMNRVFVTPPIEGWSFVVGLSLPHPLGDGYVDKCAPLLSELSSEFDNVQYFISYPETEFYGWALLRGGRFQRAYAAGRKGTVWNRGVITPEERRLGHSQFDIREVTVDGRHVTGAAERSLCESDVLHLAGRWSLDPSRLGLRSDLEHGIGYIAVAPESWHPEPAVREPAVAA